jgi:uncharacterized protein
MAGHIAAPPRLCRVVCAALVAGLTLSSCDQRTLTYLLCDPTTTNCDQAIASQDAKSAVLTSARAEDYQPIYRALLDKASTNPEILATPGFFNLIGAGTPQNPAVGLSMLRKAENQGADMAYFGLAFALNYGIGVPIDSPGAARYYAALGGPWCDAIKDPSTSFDRLIEAEEKVRGFCRVPVNQEAGFLEYESIQHALPIVSVVLGHLHENGIGTPRDPTKATAYFQQASAAGLQFGNSLTSSVPPDTTPSPSTNAPAIPSSSEPYSTGTAFAVSPDGIFLTNFHVVRGCSQLSVNSKPASVMQTDPTEDLAVVTSGQSISNYATFREPADVRAGESVVAIGFPLTGLLAPQANVTTGTVSATAGPGNNERYLQITAPVQPGNSGGPLLDASGLVVGVVSAKLDAIKMASVTGDIPENVNFAIKGSVIQHFLQSIAIQVRTTPTAARLETADIAAAAKQYTFLVECWQ